MRIIKRFLEINLNITLYTVVFLLISNLFDSFMIKESHIFMYSFISSILIYILNNTIKPILVKLTLPITGLTMGLFYFVNNVIILKLVDFLMGDRLHFSNIKVLFIISILLSVINGLLHVIILPELKGVMKNE